MPLTTNLSQWVTVTKHDKDLLINSDKYDFYILVSIYSDKQTYEFRIDDYIVLK